MTIKKLPPMFCWTKMGAEAGEELANIIRRKEWERQSGGGYFFWGIGQSLGENARIAARNLGCLHALFSPMVSKPKSIDVTPGEVVLWNAWVDAQGQTRALPNYCFITSRASLPSGRKKESHYALVCFSDKELNAQQENICVSPSYLRNVTTNKPLGSSQVTAVVCVSEQTDEAHKVKSYSVSFTTELRPPYCVQLVQPILLNASDLAEIKTVAGSDDIELWISLVKHLRSRVINHVDWVQCTLSFDNVEHLYIIDESNILSCPTI